MVKQRMDLLVRKRGMDGDVDFPGSPAGSGGRIMDAEVSAQIGLSTANAARSGSPTAMATATAPGTPGSAPWRCTFPSCGRAAACWNHGGAARKPCAVIQQAYVEGVSTRRVDDLIKALGCDGISSSQVSRICEQLDEVVESFLGRPLDGGPYPYVWLDGLRRFGRAVASSTSAWWWRRGSMPKGARFWVWTWAPARTAPSG